MSKDLELCLEDFAAELGCAPDNEDILRSIRKLKLGNRSEWKEYRLIRMADQAPVTVWRPIPASGVAKEVRKFALEFGEHLAAEYRQ